uniref:Uncharacterized protein n=1 Tax=Amphimedon queenslandica TaxID=400682 RepID=A0A1X7SSP5_AMPQE
MSLLKYFNKSVLPNPEGPLSDRVPTAVISSANKEVKDLVSTSSRATTSTAKRGPYLSYTEEEKVRIAKRAVEFGMPNTIRHFNKEMVNRPLKESTVRTWVTKYNWRVE